MLVYSLHYLIHAHEWSPPTPSLHGAICTRSRPSNFLRLCTCFIPACLSRLSAGRVLELYQRFLNTGNHLLARWSHVSHQGRLSPHPSQWNRSLLIRAVIQRKCSVAVPLLTAVLFKLLREIHMQDATCCLLSRARANSIQLTRTESAILVILHYYFTI
jgi:hypothetical protein